METRTRVTLKPGSRFAPTPTGDLHLGNVRTALVAALAARQRGHRFILRMDDLDPQAVKPGAIETQLDDLAWLGIHFDEGLREGGPCGPYAQSQRFDHYNAVLEVLNERGLLYPCWCSRKEVNAAAQAPHASDEGPIYAGTCRPSTGQPITDLADLPVRRSRKPALRLNVAAAMDQLGIERLEFQDLVQGQRLNRPTLDFGDFVVRRVDGVASYQVACAYDDWAMGCKLVLRGADLLTSTSRQILLFKLMNWSEPNFAHIGLVTDSVGERLAKRNQAISIRHLRETQCSNTAVLGLLSETLGMPKTSTFDAMVHRFVLDEGLADAVPLREQLPWDV